MKKIFFESSFTLITLLILVISAELVIKSGLLNSTLFPPPSAILGALISLKDDFLSAFSETFLNVLLGLFLSIFGGGFVAILCSFFKPAEKAFYPLAIFFQTVPIIAIAPLLVIFFGFGRPTVVVSSFIVSVFPIIANLILGLNSTPESWLDLFQIQNATRLQTLFKLKLPAAYTFIFSGLQISSGLAIIGAIAGEFVAGGGLGAMIDSARTQQRVDVVFASIILLSFMGLCFMIFWKIVSRLILQKRPFVPSKD